MREDSRKIRLDRAPGRSGRPQLPPLTFSLPREETLAFRAMVTRRGTTVNALLKVLAMAELKSWDQLGSRLGDQPTNFHQLGSTPTKEPTIDKSRAKEAQSVERNLSQTVSAAMLDSIDI